MAHAFQGKRLRGLIKAKGIRTDQISGFSRETIAKWENGHGQPTIDGLRELAVALEVSSDYLIGLGDDYDGSHEVAAAKMAFLRFEKNEPKVRSDLKERCRRIAADTELLKLQGAPRTADQWKTVALMIDAATPPVPVRLDTARRA